MRRATRSSARPADGQPTGKLLVTLAILLGILVATGAGVVYLADAQGWFRKDANSNLLTSIVKKETLEIKVTERGNLESAANVVLQSKVEGSATIIKIVDEGTAATAGQVLVELDSSKLRNDFTQQQIVVKQAEAAEKQAEENLAIQMTQNESDIAAADLALELAKLDLDKYVQGEAKQLTNQIQGEITLAQEELTRAADLYEFDKRLSKKGYTAPNQVEADRISVRKAEIGLEVAKEKMRVLVDYDYHRQLAEKKANAAEYVRELDRVKRKASAAITQFEADLSAKLLTANVERTKLKRLEDQIAACTICAPQSGLVVYANERGGRGGSQEPQVAEGSTVRERQAIINLPDISRMRVAARIHESKIDLIKEGLPARIRVDARPGEVFDGVVDSVSLVPMSANWPNFNLKEYAATIAIRGGGRNNDPLKPGLTAEVEILVDRIPDAIQTSVQAVVERGGRHFAFIVGADNRISRRELKIGLTNEVMIEIKDGLVPGERVVINPRGALQAEMAELEKEIPAEQKGDGQDAFKVPEGGMPKKRESAAPDGGETLAASDGPARSEKKKRGPGGGGNFDPSAFFAQMDKNGDGAITEDEVTDSRARERFASQDANGDKKITKEEFLEFMNKMRAGGGGPGGTAGGPGGEGGPRAGAGGAGAGS